MSEPRKRWNRRLTPGQAVRLASFSLAMWLGIAGYAVYRLASTRGGDPAAALLGAAALLQVGQVDRRTAARPPACEGGRRAPLTG